jgi:hypothetical protein
VYDIITESRADQEIEIIVSRPISDVGRPSSLAGSSGSGSGQHGQMHGSTERGYLARSGSLHSGGSKARDRPAVTVTSPASPETLHPSWGKVQVSETLLLALIGFSLKVFLQPIIRSSCGMILPPNNYPLPLWAPLTCHLDLTERYVILMPNCSYCLTKGDAFLNAAPNHSPSNHNVTCVYLMCAVKSRNVEQGRWHRHWSLAGIRPSSIPTYADPSCGRGSWKSQCGTAID